MKSEKDRPVDKISYEKPSAVDLGAAARIVGASCVFGEIVGDDACFPTGNGDAGICDQGNSAGFFCATGTGGDVPPP